ncbi:MAG TPA: (2Fe-2S)-binding protein [Burkholderiales bacterium]|jgi:bacterioferritin-associated ferredoxin|nr:(2Fe-2S)-binding protein [Burkholderiales bacterium]
MYICLCNAITERDIRSCVEEGACTMRELESSLGVGTCCGKCKPAAREILNDTRSSSRTILSTAAA